MRGVVKYRKERDFIGPEITCCPAYRRQAQAGKKKWAQSL